MIKYDNIHVLSCASLMRRLEEHRTGSPVAGDLLFLDALDVTDHACDPRLNFRFALRRELLSSLLQSCPPEGHVDARMRGNAGATVD